MSQESAHAMRDSKALTVALVVTLLTLVLDVHQIAAVRTEPSVMPRTVHATALQVSLVLHVPHPVLQAPMV